MDRKNSQENEKPRIEKIYSRKSNKLSELIKSLKGEISQFDHFMIKTEKKENLLFQKIKNIEKCKDNKKFKKVIKIVLALIVMCMTFQTIVNAIEPIMNSECIAMSKSIATRISNEQATKVMSQYSYDDLTNIIRDEKGNIKLISSNIITVNQIISDIPVLIQNELEKEKNNRFYIKLGSFTGSKLLAGRGPNIEIKMAVNGNVETNLKSEFSSAGINQTLHRIYLEVKCQVAILTPFHTIEEQIVNQVLLAEGIIVGEIPETYYNLEGITQGQSLEVIH